MFENETIINQDIKGLTITNIRIRQIMKTNDGKMYKCMFLKDVSFILLEYSKSKTMLFFFTLFTVITTTALVLLSLNKHLNGYIVEIVISGFALSVLFFVLYMVSKINTITYKSNNDKISVQINRIHFEKAKELVSITEKAINDLK